MNIRSYVYWIRHNKHTDLLTEGYIGVTSTNPNQRLSSHVHEFKVGRKDKSKFGCAIKKYGWDNLTMDVIIISTKEMCYTYEEILRPEEFIGWNTKKGGDLPPDPRYVYEESTIQSALEDYYINKLPFNEISSKHGITPSYFKSMRTEGKRKSSLLLFKNNHPDIDTDSPRCLMCKYSKDLIMESLHLYYNVAGYSRGDIEDITGLPSSYLKKIISGKAAQDLLNNFMTSYEERKIPLSLSRFTTEHYNNIISEIPKLIHEGLSVSKICKKLRISDSTYNKVMKHIDKCEV